ncbi:Pol I core factor CF [Podila epicladia]|nr:Pol I core factor CF [Podila epicladia]KAG0095122.1 Pol I core factor CF [Podila epicladia]
MVKKICPQCRSKRFTKNGTGSYVCESGHVYAGYQEEEGEFDATMGTARYRRMKGPKRKRKDTLVGQLVGIEDEKVTLQAVQLVLRHQLWWLVHEKGFPKEIQAVAREYWAACLMNFRRYQDHDLGLLQQTTKGQESTSTSEINAQDSDAKSIAGKKSHKKVKDGLDAMAEFQEPDSDTSSEDEDSDNQDDTEGEGKYGEDTAGPTQAEARKKVKTPRQTYTRTSGDRCVTQFDAGRPSLDLAVSICYLASVHLKLPVIIGDFYRWIMTRQMPYFNTASVLPPNMTRIMGFSANAALRLNNPQTIEFLNTAVYATSLSLEKGPCKIVSPEPNTSALVFRFIHELMLPVELYPCAMRLLTVLYQEYDPKTFMGDRRLLSRLHRNKSVLHPLRVVSIVVVLAKLVFGLDGKKRLERDPKSWINTLPKEQSWMRSLDIFDRLQAQVTIPTALGEMEDIARVNADLYGEFCKSTLLSVPEECTPFAATEYNRKEQHLDGSGERNVPGIDAFIRHLYMTVPPPQDAVGRNDPSAPPPLRPGEGYVYYIPDPSDTYLGHYRRLLGHVGNIMATSVAEIERNVQIVEEFLFTNINAPAKVASANSLYADTPRISKKKKKQPKMPEPLPHEFLALSSDGP